MKYIGIDYGAKHIGLAISDEAGVYAFPTRTIANDDSALQRVIALIEKEKIESIVIGDTRSAGGDENDITKKAERFMRALRDQSNLPLESMWEAWSSQEAARFAPKGKTHDDAAAAAIILQRYLELKGERESQ